MTFQLSSLIEAINAKTVGKNVPRFAQLSNQDWSELIKIIPILDRRMDEDGGLNFMGVSVRHSEDVPVGHVQFGVAMPLRLSQPKALAVEEAARRIMQCEVEHQERMRKNRRQEVMIWALLIVAALATFGGIFAQPIVLWLRAHL